VATGMRQCLTAEGEPPMTEEQMEKMCLTLSRGGAQMHYGTAVRTALPFAQAAVRVRAALAALPSTASHA
jgi:hypothetical protein